MHLANASASYLSGLEYFWEPKEPDIPVSSNNVYS